ncbi:hypothetical protein FJY63_00560 [Candidatus Sumerlaeota bacterium]|nr:hypothetical protein [Candidatus Sumerlaeota bacterium]
MNAALVVLQNVNDRYQYVCHCEEPFCGDEAIPRCGTLAQWRDCLAAARNDGMEIPGKHGLKDYGCETVEVGRQQ